MARNDLPAARWWSVRRANSRRPATYRCPFCGRHLPAMSEHLIVLPEDDGGRRRHAHTACVEKERRAGRLPSRAEWKRTQPKTPGAWRRLVDRVTGA
jgi:hypothetical protein